MPKKKAIIHKKTIARSKRITERHQHPKKTEENVAKTSGNGNPKCKLRDVKNNKKKNDKKELGRLLFAEVVDEKPKTKEKQNVAPKNIDTQENKTYVPQPLAEKSNDKKPIRERIQNCYNKINNFFYKPTAIEDLKNGNAPVNNNSLNVANNNILNVANNNKAPFNGNVINFPIIYGSEVVPKGGKINYHDFFIHNSELTFFKYMINTDALNGGNYTVFSEDDECFKTIGDIVIYFRQEGVKSANNKKWKNEVFNQSELNSFKNINEKIHKLLEISINLRSMKVDFNCFNKSKDTKQQISVQDKNGIIHKIDVNQELEAKETSDLHRFVKNLPDALKNKLHAAVINNCENWNLIDYNVNIPVASTSNCVLNRNNNSKCPLKMTRKQKRNRRRRLARSMRSCSNTYLAIPLIRDTDLEVLREDLNISNTSVDLPNDQIDLPNDQIDLPDDQIDLTDDQIDLPDDQTSNKTFDIVRESDDMNEVITEPPALTTCEEIKKLDSLEKLLIESNEILRNNISNGIVVPEIDAPAIDIDAYLYDFEDRTRVNMQTDQMFSVVNMVNERTDFKVLRFERFVKKYLLSIKYQKNVFKMHKKGSKKAKNSVATFIKKNYPFIDAQDFEESYENDSLSEYDSDIFEDLVEIDDKNIPKTREIDPKIKIRMVKYENNFFDINIAAINKLIPNEPFNQKQYDEYNKNRMNLNEQFVDIFQI